MKPFYLVLCVLSLLMAQAADAHQRSESFSQWRWHQDVLELRFSVTTREARRLFPRASPERLAAELSSYLSGRIGPEDTAARCNVARPLAVRVTTRGYLLAEAAWRCKQLPGQIRLKALFDLAEDHAHYAALEDEQRRLQAFIHASQPYWNIANSPEPSGPAEKIPDNGWSRLLESAGYGVRHALSGWDHLVFILALLLVCRRVNSLVWAVTGFTIGHSISLGLSAFGVLVPVVPLVEATIGLTIALVAAERLGAGFIASMAMAIFVFAVLMVARVNGYAATPAFAMLGLSVVVFCYLLLATQIGDSGLFRMSATVLFGLIHGLGFATAFEFIGSPGPDLLWSLAGFNLGIEVGQIMVVIFAFLTGHLAMRQFGKKPFAAELLAASVCCIGTYWFVLRSFGG
ncbi:MAG TPA: HupE/UreJ family protein [Xanthomonadales bacterium]|nr:HupE/UreJ family protein [Xanthomonadales bacterium]